MYDDFFFMMNLIEQGDATWKFFIHKEIFLMCIMLLMQTDCECTVVNGYLFLRYILFCCDAINHYSCPAGGPTNGFCPAAPV